jgi:hypothetical protein
MMICQRIILINHINILLSLKCLQLSSVKDELVEQQHCIKVMEQQLEEYSAIICNQKDKIDSMTPAIFAKQWVKNHDKRGGHMKWMVECDRLILEMLANRCPPTSIQASILAMTGSFF